MGDGYITFTPKLISSAKEPLPKRKTIWPKHYPCSSARPPLSRLADARVCAPNLIAHRSNLPCTVFVW